MARETDNSFLPHRSLECLPHHFLGTPSQASPHTSSSAKTKQNPTQPHAAASVESVSDPSLDDTRELPDSILAFPTANQPVMDTTRKDISGCWLFLCACWTYSICSSDGSPSKSIQHVIRIAPQTFFQSLFSWTCGFLFLFSTLIY